MNTTQSYTRQPFYMLIGAVVLLVIASMSFTVVPETKQALVLQYGQIVRVVNPWRPNQAYGHTGAGLTFRVPFFQQIHMIDKRLLDVQLDGQPVLSTDQLRMQVDAYARYRITDPARMYSSIRTEEALRQQLSNLLSASIRNELGKRPFATLLSNERGQVMDSIRQTLATEARRYGVQVLDVRINRADLPEGTSRDSAFARMRTARAQEVTTINADGDRQAQIIRADAQAQAARIYADSFGKDPQFYAFYRAMQSYRATFRGQGAGETNFVLKPGEGYLREFGGREPGR